MKEKFPSQQVLEECSHRWGISQWWFVRQMENVVFRGETGEGRNVYLRITAPTRRRREEIEAEITFMEHLHDNGLTVPKVVPTKALSRGASQSVVSIDDGECVFSAVVTEEVRGEHPTLEQRMDSQFLEALGRVTAQIHAAGIGIPSIVREEWNNERGTRHALQSCYAQDDQPDAPELMVQLLEKSIEWMDTLPRTSDQYGLIHGDLCDHNLFILSGAASGELPNLGVIDFDDCSYHWFAFELAVILYSIDFGLFEKGKKEKKAEQFSRFEALIRGYRQVRPIIDEEVAMIPKFMDFACLRLYFWMDYHQQLNHFHPTQHAHVEKLKRWAEARATTHPFHSSSGQKTQNPYIG